MSAVYLKNLHITLAHDLAQEIFGDATYSLLAYQVESKTLLLTDPRNTWFTKMHKAEQYLLKVKNLKGDRSLAIPGIILDHALDEQDRALSYSYLPQTQLLKIEL